MKTSGNTGTFALWARVHDRNNGRRLGKAGLETMFPEPVRQELVSFASGPAEVGVSTRRGIPVLAIRTKTAADFAIVAKAANQRARVFVHGLNVEDATKPHGDRWCARCGERILVEKETER